MILDTFCNNSTKFFLKRSCSACSLAWDKRIQSHSWSRSMLLEARSPSTSEIGSRPQIRSSHQSWLVRLGCGVKCHGQNLGTLPCWEMVINPRGSHPLCPMIRIPIMEQMNITHMAPMAHIHVLTMAMKAQLHWFTSRCARLPWKMRRCLHRWLQAYRRDRQNFNVFFWF